MLNRVLVIEIVSCLVIGCGYSGENIMLSKDIWKAIEQDNLSEVQRYASDKGDLDVCRRQYPEKNLLIHAIESNAYEAFVLLLELGANPNAFTRSGQTAMHIACIQKEAKWLESLIERGGDVNLWNETRKETRGTPLGYAASSRNPETGSRSNPWAIGIVSTLIRNGADVNSRSGEYDYNEYPIVHAAYSNNLDVVLLFLETDADYGNPGPPPTRLLRFMADVHLDSFLVEPERSHYKKVVSWIENDARRRGDQATIDVLYARAKAVEEYKKAQEKQ